MTWEVARLGSLVEFKVGKTPARAEATYWGEGHPWLSIKDMNQGIDLERTAEEITDVAVARTRPNLVPAGTVLLSFKLSVGKVGIARRPLYTNEAIAALIPKNPAQLHPGYLLRALQYVDLVPGGNDAVLGVVLNRTALEAIRIPLPPLPEQRRIAAILDEADDLHAAARQQSSLRAALVSAQFRTTSAGLDADRAQPLARFVGRISSGKSIVGTEDSDSVARVLKISAVTSGAFRGGESKPLPSGYVPPADHYVHQGDLLVSRANTAELVGATALVTSEPSQPVVLPDKLWRLTLSGADPVYMHALLSSPSFRSEVSRRATGSGGSMKNIGQSDYLSIPVRVPTVEVQREFAQRALEIHNLEAIHRQRTSQLDALFASLQHRAFRGEL